MSQGRLICNPHIAQLPQRHLPTTASLNLAEETWEILTTVLLQAYLKILYRRLSATALYVFITCRSERVGRGRLDSHAELAEPVPELQRVHERQRPGALKRLWRVRRCLHPHQLVRDLACKADGQVLQARAQHVPALADEREQSCCCVTTLCAGDIICRNDRMYLRLA
jgi:hypothetical protein